MSIFRGNGMSSQISRHDIDRMFLVEVCHYTQLHQFGFEIKTISTLPFHRRYAHVQHFVEPFITDTPQLLEITFTGGIDRIDYTTATLHDRHIAVAFQPPGKLFFTITTENKMGMTIHKPGKQCPSTGIDFQVFVRIYLTYYFFCRTDMRYNTFGNNHCSIFYNMEIRHCRPSFCFKTGTGYNLRCVPYQ